MNTSDDLRRSPCFAFLRRSSQLGIMQLCIMCGSVAQLQEVIVPVLRVQGSFQKSLREEVDRLAPMMGFNRRVVERGGTNLGALLSNKNPWSGAHCGRGVC